MLDPTSSVGISTVYVGNAAVTTVPGVSEGPGQALRSTVQVEVAAGPAGPGRASRSTVQVEDAAGPAGPGRASRSTVQVEDAAGSDCLSQPSKWRSPRVLTVFHNRLSGGRRGACRAWPGFETTRRAEGSRRGRRAGGQAPRRPKLTQLAGSEGPPSTDEQHTFARHAQQNAKARLRTGSRVL